MIVEKCKMNRWDENGYEQKEERIMKKQDKYYGRKNSVGRRKAIR